MRARRRRCVDAMTRPLGPALPDQHDLGCSSARLTSPASRRAACSARTTTHSTRRRRPSRQSGTASPPCRQLGARKVVEDGESGVSGRAAALTRREERECDAQISHSPSSVHSACRMPGRAKQSLCSRPHCVARGVRRRSSAGPTKRAGTHRVGRGCVLADRRCAVLAADTSVADRTGRRLGLEPLAEFCGRRAGQRKARSLGNVALLVDVW